MRCVSSFFVIMSMLFVTSGHAQKTVLLETEYYSFESNALLNAHLFLYNKAMACKFKKVHQDSLAHYAFKDKVKLIKPSELAALNTVLHFYADSLINKDLVLDSMMRSLSDHLTKGTQPSSGWQNSAHKYLMVFQPHFSRFYWKAIDAENKAWVLANRAQLLKQEKVIIGELERIYQTKLPSGKVSVDITCYAGWTGAFSYRDMFCHILLSAAHSANQAGYATEVLFHETSRFLADTLDREIKMLIKGKDIKRTVNLRQNMKVYTTGYVMEMYSEKEGKTFLPYYKKMKFEDKFSDFKLTVEACHLYWNSYLAGKDSLRSSLQKVVAHVVEAK